MTLVLPLGGIKIEVWDLQTALASYNSRHWFNSFSSSIRKANVFYGTFPRQIANSINEKIQILCTKFINNNRVTYWKELRSYGSYTSRLTDFSTYQYKFNRNPEENHELYRPIERYVPTLNSEHPKRQTHTQVQSASQPTAYFSLTEPSSHETIRHKTLSQAKNTKTARKTATESLTFSHYNTAN